MSWSVYFLFQTSLKCKPHSLLKAIDSVIWGLRVEEWLLFFNNHGNGRSFVRK